MLETISKSEASPEETKLVEKDLEMLKASTSASQEEPSGEGCQIAILRFLCIHVICCLFKHNLKSRVLSKRPQLPPFQRCYRIERNKGNWN